MSDVISWVDPFGVETSLSPTLPGLGGRFMPPVAFVEEKVPVSAGAMLRQVEHDVREVAIPHYLTADDQVSLRQKLRDLVKSLDPKRGEGTLKVTAVDGLVRTLRCRYASGLGFDEDSGIGYKKLILAFRATDPYWYDETLVEATYAFTGSAPATFFPIFPIVLSASEVLAQPTVNNPGDVFSWPIWTIAGPASGVTLRNLTTDKLLSLETDLVLGESVVIDTRPGVKSILKSPGNVSLWAELSTASDLFPIEEGDNVLSVEIAAAAAGTSTSLQFSPRFLSP